MSTIDWSGGVLLHTHEDTVERFEREKLVQLIHVGGKLAVLGVEDGPRAMGYWHVARPGSWSPPQDSMGGVGPEGVGLVYARALCHKFIVTNGYCADWRPPAGILCPACAEQI
jgi:hypothetical protein